MNCMVFPLRLHYE